MPVKKNKSVLDISTIDRLNTSEARFRSMFDTAAVGIGMLSLDRKLMEANPALCRMFGLSRDELIGKSPAIFTYPEDNPASTQQFIDLLSGPQDYFWGERRYIRNNGEVFWAHASMSVVRDENRKPLYIIGMLIDINEQKYTLAELQQSEARFRAIFENAAIGIVLVSPDRKVLMANEAMVQMSGFSHEELLGKNGPELIFSKDLNIDLAELDELTKGERDWFQVERNYVHKNGTPYWVKQTLSAVRNASEEIIYLVVMVEDINQQKKDQETLRQSEVRFKAMFDNTSVGIALTDLNRKIIQVNEAAARITGYSRSELEKINPVELSLPEDRLIGQDALQEMIAGQRAGMTVERRYVRKNGSIYWGRVTYSLVRDQNGEAQYLIGLIEDINEQKLAAEKLSKQEAENRRSLELKVEDRTRELRVANMRLVNEIEQRQRVEAALASRAAEEAVSAERTRLARDLHDAVTQTLFSASLIAEVLPELWEQNPDEARKTNEELRQLTRGALAEMRTLLFELRPASLTEARFPDLIKQLSEVVIGRARLPVNLTVEGDYELPPDVKVAFYRIAQESLNNIVKYSRATQVEIRIQLNCCDVRLEIKDNGVGFDPGNTKPTSLGMRIMRERAETIHANLCIYSTPGGGTNVTVDWNEDELIQSSTIPILR